MNKIILSFDYSQQLAKEISKFSKIPYYPIEKIQFPDKESMISIAAKLSKKEIIIVASLDNPNEKLIDILIAIETTKSFGAQKITLIAPYLCYMRQDKQFKPGQAISAKIIAKFLSSHIDKLITIDPHLHRIKKLNDVYTAKTATLTAIKNIEKFIKSNYNSPIIIGPDGESYQWAKTIADNINAKSIILKKVRYSGTKVKIYTTKELEQIPKSQKIIIIDDIISSGTTLLYIGKFLKQKGYNNLTTIAVHGIFANSCYPKLKKYYKEIITTNTIKHQSNKISIADLLAKEI